VLAAYLAAVFGGGALLAPWLWKLAQTLAPGSHLAGQPFHRYVNRSLLALAVLGLWPLYRRGFFGGFSGVGPSGLRPALRRAGFGLMLGFTSLALAAGAAVAFHARAVDPGLGRGLMLLHLARATGAAVAVGMIEEAIFRGFVFGALRRTGGFLRAAAASSALYALVHFFRRPESPAEIGPWSGFDILAGMSAGFADWQSLVPGLLNLAIAGWILARCVERTGSLWLSVGLHAGWIFWLKSYAFLTRPQPLADSWVWGTSKLIDGWIALLALGLTAAAVEVATRPAAIREDPAHVP
jgi:membrane protease YdiL (CAAX protease family)